jgi:ATP adenylyltransferase
MAKAKVRGAVSRSRSKVSSPSPARRAGASRPPRGLEEGADCVRASRLWAPWRLEYILAAKPDGCIFCDFPAEVGEENDRRNLVVHRSPRSFTILNRYPYNSGHVMVIPRPHVEQLEALSREEFADLHEELRLAARVIREVYRPEGLNVGMNLGRIAGAGIDEHLHYHVVPRWGGDTNFMPVLADTRVMVEHLDGAWQKIRAGFEKELGAT